MCGCARCSIHATIIYAHIRILQHLRNFSPEVQYHLAVFVYLLKKNYINVGNGGSSFFKTSNQFCCLLLGKPAGGAYATNWNVKQLMEHAQSACLLCVQSGRGHKMWAARLRPSANAGTHIMCITFHYNLTGLVLRIWRQRAMHIACSQTHTCSWHLVEASKCCKKEV